MKSLAVKSLKLAWYTFSALFIACYTLENFQVMKYVLFFVVLFIVYARLSRSLWISYKLKYGITDDKKVKVHLVPFWLKLNAIGHNDGFEDW